MEAVALPRPREGRPPHDPARARSRSGRQARERHPRMLVVDHADHPWTRIDLVRAVERHAVLVVAVSSLCSRFSEYVSDGRSASTPAARGLVVPGRALASGDAGSRRASVWSTVSFAVVSNADEHLRSSAEASLEQGERAGSARRDDDPVEASRRRRPTPSASTPGRSGVERSHARLEVDGTPSRSSSAGTYARLPPTTVRQRSRRRPSIEWLRKKSIPCSRGELERVPGAVDQSAAVIGTR